MVETGGEPARCGCHNSLCGLDVLLSQQLRVAHLWMAPVKRDAAVTSAGVCLQCICGGTEEATQP